MANDFINCAPKAVPHQAAKSGELAIATEDCRWSYGVPRELSVLASKKSRWPRADSQARGECWLQNPAPATWSTEARVRELSRRPEHFVQLRRLNARPKGVRSLLLHQSSRAGGWSLSLDWSLSIAPCHRLRRNLWRRALSRPIVTSARSNEEETPHSLPHTALAACLPTRVWLVNAVGARAACRPAC